MAITFEAAVNAINTRWKEQVEDGQTPRLPTEYDGHTLPDDEKPDDALWARVSVRPASHRQAEMGTKRMWRRNGVFLVQIFAPLDSGMQAINALVDDIDTAFRGKTVSGILYRAPNPEYIGATEENWNQMNVVIPWQVDDRET